MEIIITEWYYWPLIFLAVTLVAFLGFVASGILAMGSRSDLETEIIRLKSLSEAKQKVILAQMDIGGELAKDLNHARIVKDTAVEKIIELEDKIKWNELRNKQEVKQS